MANVNFLYDIVHALERQYRLVHKFGNAQIDAVWNTGLPNSVK